MTTAERPPLESPATSDDAATEPSLRRQVRNALGWSTAGLAIGRVGTLVTGIILARILSPSDYGVFAVALVALLLIANLNDLGVEQTLVRWPGEIRGVAPTAKTLILASSFVQFVAMFVLAPAFCSAMNSPDATGVVRLLSFGIVVNGLFAVSSGVLTRALRQDRRTTADFIGFLFTLAVTIGLAVGGFGVWSLAWGRIIGNFVNGGLYAVFATERYRFGFDRPVARELLRQGLPLAGTSILAVAVLNVDTLVVGRTLGATQLGFYVMAFNLSSWPVSVFGVAIWRVAVPAFARLQDDLARLREGFTRSFGLIMAVILPLCVLLGVLALPLIRLVYGATWVDAAPVLHALALLAALRIATQLMTDVLVAVGRGRTAFRLQAVWLVALVPALTVGAHLGGIVGVGWAHLLTAGLVVVPLHLRAIRPLGIRFGALARATARPAAATISAAIVAVVIVVALVQPDPIVLLAAGSAALVVLVVIMAPMRHEALAMVR